MAPKKLADRAINLHSVGHVHQIGQADPSPRADHFVERDGLLFAGAHLLIDLDGAEGLDDLARVEDALRRSVDAAGATLLHIHLHHFSPEGGISGVAVLAESHISIHTWPERDYAALDVFMCGECDPYRTLPVLRQVFRPEKLHVTEHKRGLVV